MPKGIIVHTYSVYAGLWDFVVFPEQGGTTCVGEL